MAQEYFKSHLTGISYNLRKEMASFSHTSPCSMSKYRSSLEAGKKRPRVWLQYACSMTEMLLYPSFSAPLLFLWSPYSDSEVACTGFEEGSKCVLRVTHFPVPMKWYSHVYEPIFKGR